MTKSMTLKPRLTEKAYALSKAQRKYIFFVPKNATKLTVARAVKSQFDVEVTSVRIANAKAKTKRTFYKKGAKSVYGRGRHTKRAYVTLKSGHQIPIYAALEEKEAKTTKAETKAKK